MILYYQFLTYMVWLGSSRNYVNAHLTGAVKHDLNKDICACFNLHQWRFKHIKASCMEVALIRCVCFYVSLQKWLAHWCMFQSF